MNGKDLLNGMNCIDEALIQEADEDNLPGKKSRRSYPLPKLAAACAAVILAVSAAAALAVFHGQHKDPESRIVKVTEEIAPPETKKPADSPRPAPADETAGSSAPLTSGSPDPLVMTENPGHTDPMDGQRATQTPESNTDDTGKNGPEGSGAQSTGTPRTGSDKPTKAPSGPAKTPARPTKAPAAPTKAPAPSTSVPSSPDDEYLVQGGRTETPGPSSETPSGPYDPGNEPAGSDDPVFADPAPTPAPSPKPDPSDAVFADPAPDFDQQQ